MKLKFWRRKRDEELEEEIQSHLRMAARERMERGEGPKEAEHSAKREMGNVALVKETTRDTWGWMRLSEIAQDLRYGVRMLRKNPTFSVVAILTLALGIGVNTALFTAFYAVSTKTIQVDQPQNVVRVMKWFSDGAEGDNQFAFSYAEYLYYREHSEIFSGAVAMSWPTGMTASLQRRDNSGQAYFENSSPVVVQIVSDNFFTELGVHSIYGRTFGGNEEVASSSQPVIVLSYPFWQRAFRSDPRAIGAPVRINGIVFSVIGVTPMEFSGTANPPIEPDFWLSIGMQAQLIPGHDWINDPREHSLQILGRLAPGLTPLNANSGLGVAFHGYQPTSHEYPESERVTQLSLQAATYFGETHDWRFQTFAAMLMVVTGLVLLIACANLANMLMARATVRRREICTRMALGASRGRLVRQLLTESTLLALLGGGAGLILSMWASKALWLEIARVMESTLGPNLATVIQMDLNLRVFAYAMLLSFFTGTAFGLSPALQATRADLSGALKDEGNAGSGGARRPRPRNLLVAGQVAGSMFLLISAGLLSRALLNSQSADPGFDTKSVFELGFDRSADPQKANAIVRQISDHLKTLPEIESYCVVDKIPFNGTWTPPMVAERSPTATENSPARTLANHVSSGYFATLRIPILRGRTFDEQEKLGGANVAIVSDSAARRFWPGMDPVGKRIKLDLNFRGHWAEFEVVGVAKDVRTANLSRTDTSFVYLPTTMSNFYNYNLLVRPRPDVINNLSVLRNSLRAWTPELGLGENVESFLKFQRLLPEAVAKFALTLAFLAIVLAAVGIYGVMAFLVSQRTREIGIRVSMGAMPRDVLRVFIAQGLRPVLAGGVIGLIISAGFSTILRSILSFPGSPDLLFGVDAFDPATFIGFSLFLAAVALLACYIPARRALKVDPIVALRYE